MSCVDTQLVGVERAPQALRRARAGRWGGWPRGPPGRPCCGSRRRVPSSGMKSAAPGAGDPARACAAGDGRDAHRVGAHVGDEADGLAADSFVELLGDAHGTRGAHAEPVARRLLEGAGGERRHGPAALLALRHRSDGELRALECRREAVGRGFVRDGRAGCRGTAASSMRPSPSPGSFASSASKPRPAFSRAAWIDQYSTARKSLDPASRASR